MKVITAKGGAEIFVDDAFHDILSTKRWYIVHGYARCYHKGEHLYMHRLVMEEPKGMTIDHLDRNRLNNQRANLEVVTGSENSRRVSVRQRAAQAYDRYRAKKVYEHG